MKSKNVYITLITVVLLSLLLCVESEAARFPKPVGHVNDFAGVMDSGTASQLENALRDVKAKTGAEIAVVTVSDMGGIDESTYAVELMKEWGIGSKERNDGILLLAAVKERRLRIEVGYGLEHVITDATAGQIRDRYIVPYLKQNDYNSGLTQGALVVASLIAKDKGVELGGSVPVAQRPSGRRRSSGGIAPLINLFVIIAIFLILSRSRGGRGLLMGMLIGGMLGGGRRNHYGGGFGGGFSGGGGFGGFGGGFSGGGGASGGF